MGGYLHLISIRHPHLLRGLAWSPLLSVYLYNNSDFTDQLYRVTNEVTPVNKVKNEKIYG